MKTCSRCKVKKELTRFSFDSGNKDGLYSLCKDCKNLSSRVRYLKNREKESKRALIYYNKNKEVISETKKKWYKKNYDNIKKSFRDKYKTNPLFKLKVNLRNRTRNAFKYKGYYKNTKTQEMLGVNWDVCKEHIERQFTKGMNWENHGEWHIDHIIPLGSAKTEKEIIKLCHYSNLQPLWAFDNLSKSAKIIGQQNKLRI